MDKSVSSTEGEQAPTPSARYRSKVTTQTLDIEPPETKLPVQIEEDAWQINVEKEGISFGQEFILFYD